jgi:hypothetical protein
MERYAGWEALREQNAECKGLINAWSDSYPLSGEDGKAYSFAVYFHVLNRLVAWEVFQDGHCVLKVGIDSVVWAADFPGVLTVLSLPMCCMNSRIR